jgi:hypothetical protein
MPGTRHEIAGDERNPVPRSNAPAPVVKRTDRRSQSLPTAPKRDGGGKFARKQGGRKDQ